MNNTAVGMNTSLNASSMNNSISIFMNSMDGMDEDNAQSILENHLSRVGWDESVGQTPTLTPGRHSPDRVQNPGAGSSSSMLHPGSNQRNQGSGALHHSLQAFDGGVEDNKQAFVTPALVAAAGAAASTLDSHHKHYHHHHHHHHHIHKDNKALRTSQSGHMPPGTMAPYASTQGAKDSSSSKRATPLPGATPSKRIPDNNSNIDSGIYDLPNANAPVPNFSHPANEK